MGLGVLGGTRRGLGGSGTLLGGGHDDWEVMGWDCWELAGGDWEGAGMGLGVLGWGWGGAGGTGKGSGGVLGLG